MSPTSFGTTGLLLILPLDITAVVLRRQHRAVTANRVSTGLAGTPGVTAISLLSSLLTSFTARTLKEVPLVRPVTVWVIDV